MSGKNKCYVCRKESDKLLIVRGMDGKEILLCDYCNKTYLGVKK